MSAALERLLREAAPDGTDVVVDWRARMNGGALDASSAEVGVAQRAIERHFGVVPFVTRVGGSLPLFQTLAARNIPTVSTGFGIYSEANMHAPNECFPVAHLEPGLAAVEDMLAGFADVGSPSAAPPTLDS